MVTIAAKSGKRGGKKQQMPSTAAGRPDDCARSVHSIHARFRASSVASGLSATTGAGAYLLDRKGCGPTDVLFNAS
jgi:hypothetical protein